MLPEMQPLEIQLLKLWIACPLSASWALCHICLKAIPLKREKRRYARLAREHVPTDTWWKDNRARFLVGHAEQTVVAIFLSLQGALAFKQTCFCQSTLGRGLRACHRRNNCSNVLGVADLLDRFDWKAASPTSDLTSGHLASETS